MIERLALTPAIANARADAYVNALEFLEISRTKTPNWRVDHYSRLSQCRATIERTLKDVGLDKVER